MSTEPKPKIRLSAEYLGPVFSLDGTLTKHAQNLVFARNGTGKSFLSRALRYLDLYGQDRDIQNAPSDLVSDESADGLGRFFFGRESTEMGSLQLDRNGGSVTASVNDTIFHVFSEDFVQEELRERSYEIDGAIDNQISVDRENIKLKDSLEELDKAYPEAEKVENGIRERFEASKRAGLGDKAGINRNLKEYGELVFKDWLSGQTEKPAAPERNQASILKDLDRLKSIPAEPRLPKVLDTLVQGTIDLKKLSQSLRKLTSPSTVADHIKQKIDTHREFYAAGTRIVEDSKLKTCPFCEQGITDPDPKSIIDAYLNYFSDEEEKHKTELRHFFSELNHLKKTLDGSETLLARQKSRFDQLKQFVPSKREAALSTCELELAEARKTIALIQGEIELKAESLASEHSLPRVDLEEQLRQVNTAIEANNSSVLALNQSISKSDDERRSLQRRLCLAFSVEFAIDSWNEIEELRALEARIESIKRDIRDIEKTSPSAEARVRVADTFELLLKQFFGNKYVFDKEDFVLKRGAREMTRGPHRTLSDGEKTAIAFCYFVACVHRKVSSNSDYGRLYLVFDDPVTSMSYDFVFAIAQTLKNLSLSDQGEVSMDPSKIDGTKCRRPELLVLTHSSYFFNVSRTNRVVQNDATFSLHGDGSAHKLTYLKDYVAPFEQQLEHVYRVANGEDPNHSTGNAIRSVLEAIGRFCRPDKANNLQDFIAFLAGEEGILLKSVLINSLCHGTYYEETPAPDDLKLACEEAISVVERFAVGQLELIKQ